VSKRLAFLEKATADGSTDPFVWYGLGMEYRTLKRIDEALQTFTTLRTTHPDYVPSYHMCAQMLTEAERKDEARAWLEAGIATAKRTGNTHALSEMQDALDAL
jgi:tetratricopeptide (TPR) repeat protein